MTKYDNIKNIFEKHTDKENSIHMAAYMRNQFEFYGIRSAMRKELYKIFLQEEKKTKQIDWKFLDKCFTDRHREFQYLACDYLAKMSRFLTTSDLPKIREYIITKSWWDTTDSLCKLIGNISLRDDSIGKKMLEWACDENIWIRRTAIEYQLGLKEKTDTKILESILLKNFGSDEFFINKAIGWALRDYSKTNSKWVENFIFENRDKMNSLSIREGSKYI